LSYSTSAALDRLFHPAGRGVHDEEPIPLADGSQRFIVVPEVSPPKASTGSLCDPTGRLLAVGVHQGLILYDLHKREVHRRLETMVRGAPLFPRFFLQ
jgi:hypothetical protein